MNKRITKKKILNGLFNYVKRIDKQVSVILQEPYTENSLSFNYKKKDYQHYFTAYLKKFGFRLIGFNETSSGFRTFYFVTR